MNRAVRVLVSQSRYMLPSFRGSTPFRTAYSSQRAHHGVRYLCLARTHTTTEEKDSFIEQIESFEDHTEILNFIHNNQGSFTPAHFSKALDALWLIQSQKDKYHQSFDVIGKSPLFGRVCEMILQQLEGGKVDNDFVISNLYALSRLRLDSSNLLSQQLFLKGCRSVGDLDIPQLSKFVATLRYVGPMYYRSPIMAEVIEIVRHRLSDITHIREFSQLMIGMARLSSPDLNQQLVEKAMELMVHCEDDRNPNNVGRILRALNIMKMKHRKLLEMISRYFLAVLDELDIHTIFRIKDALKDLNYYNRALEEGFRRHLLFLMPDSHDSFPKSMIPCLLWCLGPLAPTAVKRDLETLALYQLPDNIQETELVTLLQALEAMGCRNQNLLQKVAKLVQPHISHEHMKLRPVLQSAKTFIATGYDDQAFLSQLRYALISIVGTTFKPPVVAECVNCLAQLPGGRLEDAVVKKIHTMLPQLSFAELGLITQSLRTLTSNTTVQKTNQRELSDLFRNVNATVIERLHNVTTFRTLHKVVLSYYVESPAWTATFLIDEIIKWYERNLGEVDRLTGINLATWAMVMSRTRIQHGLILDTLANATVRKMHTLQNDHLLTVLSVFAFLNYSPTNAEEFFGVCVDTVVKKLWTISPHVLVRLAYSLAQLQQLPVEIVKKIFQVKFLEQLDTYLERSKDHHNAQLRDTLMRVNRAVVLEYPEYDIPWFHGQYCTEVAKKVPVLDGVEKQVQEVLTDFLGGPEFVRSKVISPYFQTIDFECYLTEEGSALPCVEYGDFWNRAEGCWQKATKPLPTTAHRVAVDYQDARDFCRNSQHLLGHVAMRKRHLEILGYTVVQIPHFEWNSMKLATEESWKEYLEQKLSAAVGR
ncbi:FAST kinase domain-containing protein 1, mitochondrial-like [Branchiostoma lanceolatum]|uniref:FAST kinase domain-containing protein 1, mitochondrial-like n=1 Tax=Branchiostoma lanceolatum TaxID=7740 RepID=UPI00345203B1